MTATMTCIRLLWYRPVWSRSAYSDPSANRSVPSPAFADVSAVVRRGQSPWSYMALTIPSEPQPSPISLTRGSPRTGSGEESRSARIFWSCCIPVSRSVPRGHPEDATQLAT